TLDELAIAPVARQPELGHAKLVIPPLCLEQEPCLALDLLALPIEGDENRHLLLHHLGVERLDQVVDRAHVVRAIDLPDVRRDRGQKEDGDRAGPLELLQVLRDLEAVHPRHDDVEQDHGEAFAQRDAERLFAGARGEQAVVGAVQDGLERDEVLGLVIDEQEVHRSASFGAHWHFSTARSPPTGRWAVTLWASVARRASAAPRSRAAPARPAWARNRCSPRPARSRDPRALPSR